MKSALIPVAAKWKDIGTALRLKAGDLDAIEAAHPGNPQACLSEGVTHWLRRNYNSKRFGPPTWRKLVEVVADPAAGGNPALAREIALEHCSKVHTEINLGNNDNSSILSVQQDDSTTTKYIPSDSNPTEETEVVPQDHSYSCWEKAPRYTRRLLSGAREWESRGQLRSLPESPENG